jgi:hypothetical protein
MLERLVPDWLGDDQALLARYTEGKYIDKILACRETKISLLLSDGTIVDFVQMEDEIIVDIIPSDISR